MVDPFRLRWACGSPLVVTGAGGLNKFSASREASRGVLEDEAWPLAVPLVVWDILGGTGDLFTVDGFVLCGQEVDCAGVSSLTMTVRRTMGRGGDPDDGWDALDSVQGFIPFAGQGARNRCLETWHHPAAAPLSCFSRYAAPKRSQLDNVPAPSNFLIPPILPEPIGYLSIVAPSSVPRPSSSHATVIVSQNTASLTT